LDNKVFVTIDALCNNENSLFTLALPLSYNSEFVQTVPKNVGNF